MKKVAVFLILFFVCNCNELYSQKFPTEDIDNINKLMFLINMDLDNNFDQIQEISKDIKDASKLYIYEKKESDLSGPFFLNLMLGFGVGSWVQGDNLGGIIFTSSELIGLFMLAYDFYEVNSDRTNNIIGGYLWLTSRAVSVIWPFVYSYIFDNKLKESLNISDVSQLSIYPRINVAQNYCYPALAFQVSF